MAEDYAALTDAELLRYWNTVRDFDERDRLMEVMILRRLFPEETTNEWEKNTGAYPDIADPQFIEKLLKRREFADSYQSDWRPKDDPCDEDAEEFNVSSVQRFVANFMSPKTPYRSALLYHGTGVGKTCSGIQIAEQWLYTYPNKKVIILAPPTIQKGIVGNIFNINKVRLGEEEGEPNSAVQCTGNYYMESTGTMFERDRKRIENKAMNLIRRRYEIYGYGEFANKIDKKLKAIPSNFTGEERRQRERKMLNDEYGGRLIIIDEVHNLRDVPEDGQDKEGDAPAGPGEQLDEAEGKVLTPIIRKLIDLANDIKLVTMTATPMYNSYMEIIFLFNLLLRNDRKPLLRLPDIFQADGSFRPRTRLADGRIIPGGREKLGRIASHYVSYMRGENPITFPLRLDPRGVPRITDYPNLSPSGNELDADAAEFTQRLTMVPVEFQGDSLAAQEEMMDDIPEGTELNAMQTAPFLQAGTCVVPPIAGADLKTRASRTGLNLHFHQQVVGGEVIFKAKQAGGASWLAVDELQGYAPKIATVIKRIETTIGVCFVYTRFVRMGAIPFILALEANGYTPYGRRLGYLSDGMQVEGGRRCALCSGREKDHEPHAFEPADFVPAKYVLLTGDKTLSPKKDDHIQDEKQAANKDGGIIKVVVGSSVASEGVDLKFIREIHILEGWFHLNKTEQIVGRGIRTCSHALLPKEKRNCTVYLYAGVLPEEDGRESVDLYTYRIAYSKGRQIGAVSRLLKERAIDCSLNHKAIVINTSAKRQIINAQGKGYVVSLKDKPFTAICDWMESCDYSCQPVVPVEEWIDRRETSEVSYDEYTSRWFDSELRRQLRDKFAEQPSYRKLDLFNAFGEYPTLARAALFNSVINNPTFVVNYKGRNGYIIERNDYFVFQPFDFGDLRIPIAIRAAHIPVRQDSYGPEFFDAKTAQMGEEAEAKEEEEATEAPTTTSMRRVLDAWSEWTVELTRADAELPDDVITWTIGDSKEIGRREERRRMLAWFAESVRNATATIPAQAAILFAQMRQVLMEYFFDEELSQAERQSFFTDEELRVDGAQIAPEQFLHEGRRNVFVYIDLETGNDKYVCEGGKPCTQSIINHFKGDDPEDSEAEKKARNPVYGLKVDVTTTGSLYGFIVPKYDASFVFKTNKPPAVGKKVTKGQECANVSAATDHRNKLIELGKIIQKAIGTNFELTELILTEGDRKLLNVNQICVLTDLFLRFMDIARINGKRWFYRPVASKITGHLPSLRK